MILKRTWSTREASDKLLLECNISQERLMNGPVFRMTSRRKRVKVVGKRREVSSVKQASKRLSQTPVPNTWSMRFPFHIRHALQPRFSNRQPNWNDSCSNPGTIMRAGTATLRIPFACTSTIRYCMIQVLGLRAKRLQPQQCIMK